MPRLGIVRRLLAVSYLLLCSFAVVHAQVLPNLPATGTDAASDALTLHMSYCSECYPNPTDAPRRAACHRLALSKFFLTECTQTNDAACIGTATLGISASFNSLNSPASDPRVGLAATLQCRRFSTEFITPNTAVLQETNEPQLVSDSLAETLEDALRDAASDILDLPVLPGEDIIESTVVELLFSKARPSGIPDQIPNLDPRSKRLILDPVFNPSTRLGNRTSQSTTAEHIDLDEDGEGAGAGFGVSPTRNVELAAMLGTDGGSLGDNPFGLAPFTSMSSPTDSLVLPTVVRQRGGRRPQVTKITVTFTRAVRYGRVAQVFRLLLRQNFVLRVYRPGFRIARVNPRKYSFYAYFSESFQRVFNSLRPRFEQLL